MVNPFKFCRTPDIHFGAGKITILSREILKYGKNALIITGAKSFVNSKYWIKLQNELKSEGIIYNNEIIAIEPSPLLVDGIVEKYAHDKIDVIVAIGGGSVLDGGKAISAMLHIKEPIKNYLEGVGKKKHPGTKIPFIAIPTTAGTGSETTKNAVISQIGYKGFKKSLRHDNLVPDVAIVDPILSMNCTPMLTAVCGMDAFTQLLESYLSTAASPLTDVLAIKGIQNIVTSIETAYNADNNYVKHLDARRKLSFASMISGITLANAGLGVIHGIASSIGGFFDIPHGVICGTLMGAANRVTILKLRQQKDKSLALEKFAEIGKLFNGGNKKNNEYYCDFLLDKLDEMIYKMEIPKLGHYGISEQDIKKIVGNSSNKNNPIQLKNNEIAEIISSRI